MIQKGDKVLDLGCSPGSWLLYAAQRVGENGRVVGIDLKSVATQVPPHVRVYTGDILDMDEALSESVGSDYNVVLSDMAPATTGIKDVDAARSLNLCEAALAIAQDRLLPGGNFVCKIFQGGDFKAFSDRARKRFKKTKIFKPESCRKASKEIYIIGIEKI